MTEQQCDRPDQTPINAETAQSPAAIVRRSGRLRTEQQWEIVRQLLHPMLMQNYSGQAIADAFGISVDTAYRWKHRLLDDLRKEAVTMQPRDFIMESVSSLRQVRAEAWAGFHAATDQKDQRAYLNSVIQAEVQIGRMGERIGLYGGRGQNPLDANAYGEVRDGDQNEMTLVRELQFRLVELLSGSETNIECCNEAEQIPYDDLLSELRAGPNCPAEEAQPGMTLPARRRQRRRAVPS